MTSDTCRNIPRIIGGTGGRVCGNRENVGQHVFRRSKEFSSCDSDGEITTKIPSFSSLTAIMKQHTAFSKIIAFELDILVSG